MDLRKQRNLVRVLNMITHEYKRRERERYPVKYKEYISYFQASLYVIQLVKISLRIALSRSNTVFYA